MEKMGFVDHLRELRKVLTQGAVVLIGVFLILLSFNDKVLEFMLYPHDKSNSLLEQHSTIDKQNLPKLMSQSYEAPVISMLKSCLYCSLFISLPLIIILFWNFLRKGLYRNEKVKIISFGGLSILFFLSGCSIGFFILLPYTLYFLVVTSPHSTMQLLYSLPSYLSLVMMLTIVVGIIFQIPVIMGFLANIGLVTWRGFLKIWKYCVVIIFILSAILTPTTDVISQLMLAVPMLGLYILGIMFAYFVGKKDSSPHNS